MKFTKVINIILICICVLLAIMVTFRLLLRTIMHEILI